MAQLPADDAVVGAVIDGLGQMLRLFIAVLYYTMLLVGWLYRGGAYVGRRLIAHVRDPRTRERWRQMWERTNVALTEIRGTNPGTA